jgi:hypothetical protein
MVPLTEGRSHPDMLKYAIGRPRMVTGRRDDHDIGKTRGMSGPELRLAPPTVEQPHYAFLAASAGIDLKPALKVALLLDTADGRVLQAKFPTAATRWVPEHYFVEVAGAICHAELNGNITPAHAAFAFAGLELPHCDVCRSDRSCPKRGPCAATSRLGDAL